MTINDILQKIKKTSSQKVLDEVFAKIEEFDDYHSLLNLTKERAYQRAKLVDKGQIKGRLAGVPFVAKDNYLAFGAPTTAGSKMLENFEAPLQATAINKLEAEGAICVGKANLDAFAHGSSTENSDFGVTKNAVDPTKVAGGSSGGSAVAVALGLVPFALGSDTGGSIRQPASHNGVIGVKPTYGMVSRFGVIAMASSTDCMGVFTNNVIDAELVLDVMAGQDRQDMTTLPDFFQPQTETPQKLRIGLLKQGLSDKVQPEVVKTVKDFAQKISQAGHQVEEIDLPMAESALAIYYVVTSAEISSNLARFDGVRYGHQSPQAQTLSDLYGQSRNQGLNIENKRRIMIGSFVLSSGYFDAYYLKAQKARTLLIQEFTKLFKNYDILLSPVVPTTAFKIGKKTDPVEIYLEDVMTVPASLAGLPTLSLPAGQDHNQLPIGVQLISHQQNDAQLLAFAREMEKKNV